LQPRVGKLHLRKLIVSAFVVGMHNLGKNLLPIFIFGNNREQPCTKSNKDC